MQIRSALLAATVLATPIAANAQPVYGLYVGAGAGINATQQTNVNGVTLGIPATVLGGTLTTNGNVDGSIGFAGVASVGWGFGNGLRLELEGNYRQNHNSNFSSGNGNFAALAAFNTFGTTGRFAGGGSTEQKFGGMVNVLYDFNGVWPWVVPYIGVGVGYAGIKEDWNVHNGFAFTVPGPSTHFSSRVSRDSSVG